MTSGPATGRRKRVIALRALLPCLALITFDAPSALAQTLTSELLRPVRDGFLAPQDSLLRKTGDNLPPQPPDPNADVRPKNWGFRSPR